MPEKENAIRRWWKGYKLWLRALWHEQKLDPKDRIRAWQTLMLIAVVLLLSFCAGKALGAEPSGAWEPLANEFSNFTLTEPTKIRYGVDQRWNVFDLDRGTYPCHYGQFGDPAPGNFGKKCQKFVPVAAPPPPPPPVAAVPAFELCELEKGPLLPLRVKLHRRIPASVGSTTYTHYAVWPCKDGKTQAQLYTLDQFLSFMADVVSGGQPSEAEANAWVKTRPIGSLTKAEWDFRKEVERQHAIDLGLTQEQPPPPPPAPRAVVAAGAVDRPVYRLRADGSRNTTAVSGIRVASGAPCNPDKRPAINPGSYMSVQGQKATSGATITEDLYASCTLTQ